MRSLFIAPFWFCVACGSLSAYDDALVESPEGEHEHDSHAFEGQFRMTTMHVVAETDLDGDGIVDNHLPEALAVLEMLPSSDAYDLDSFNDRVDENLAGTTRILLEAHAEHEELELVVVAETEGELQSADEARLPGTLLDVDGTFDAGPGDLILPIVIYPDAPLSMLRLAEANLAGELTADGTSGRMTVILPIASIIDDIIAPLAVDGWDVDGDGEPETQDEVLDFAWDFVPLLADVELEDGSPGVSAALDFEAIPEAW